MLRTLFTLVCATLAVGARLLGDGAPQPSGPECFADVDATALGNEVLYIDVDPLVLDARIPEPVRVVVQTDGSVDRVLLETVRTPGVRARTLPLAPASGDRYEITLTPDQYNFDDARNHPHPLIAYLDTYRGDAQLGRRQLRLNVAGDQVPDVRVADLGGGAVATPRVFGLYLPGRLPFPLDLQEVAWRFYGHFKDDYDLLAVVSVPMVNANRRFITVQNAVTGIGLAAVDRAASYSSAGRLQGILRFPIPYFFDLGHGDASHEIGHRWINFLRAVDGLHWGLPHWPVSSLAPGVMGFTIPGGGGGGEFPYEFERIGDGTYRLVHARRPLAFTDLDLYLMGLLPADAVGPHFTFADQGQTVCDGCVLTGAVPVTVQDVVAAYGPRAPAYPNTPSVFTVATIVVSTLRPLTPRDMAFFDHFAARGEATTPLVADAGQEPWPFALATRGRGRLVTLLGA